MGSLRDRRALVAIARFINAGVALACFARLFLVLVVFAMPSPQSKVRIRAPVRPTPNGPFPLPSRPSRPCAGKQVTYRPDTRRSIILFRPVRSGRILDAARDLPSTPAAAGSEERIIQSPATAGEQALPSASESAATPLGTGQ
jgi:hypothetical protein